eukprot:5054067-Alexandrium_andersonii.AAC.1
MHPHSNRLVIGLDGSNVKLRAHVGGMDLGAPSKRHNAVVESHILVRRVPGAVPVSVQVGEGAGQEQRIGPSEGLQSGAVRSVLLGPVGSGILVRPGAEAGVGIDAKHGSKALGSIASEQLGELSPPLLALVKLGTR